MSKFKIGQTIFFLEGSEPKRGKIEGISTFQGQIKDLHKTIDLAPDQIKTFYHVGSYTSTEETNAYESIEALQNSISDKLLLKSAE